MKEVQRKATENRLKLLSQHQDVIKWCQNKLLKKHQISTINNNSLLIDSTIEINNSKNLEKIDTTTDYLQLENDLLLNDQQSNPLDESSNINQSLIESKVMKQVKQHLNSEKYLTEREKKLRLRRKHAEEIIAWKKKLDDEELQVREIEKKANLALISNKNDTSVILNETSYSTKLNNNNNNNNKSIIDDESQM